MQASLVPCNSLADFDDSSESSQASTANSTPQMPNKVKRKSRASETDFSIIEKSMSIERKKTLMCTEQSTFGLLHKLKTKKLPGKKYSAMAPSEYEKYIIKTLNIHVGRSDGLKYEYPKEFELKSEENGKISEKDGNKRKTRSTTCRVF
jgi:hypothetical protein